VRSANVRLEFIYFAIVTAMLTLLALNPKRASQMQYGWTAFNPQLEMEIQCTLRMLESPVFVQLAFTNFHGSSSRCSAHRTLYLCGFVNRHQFSGGTRRERGCDGPFRQAG
jgi:hypothetical protein